MMSSRPSRRAGKSAAVTAATIAAATSPPIASQDTEKIGRRTSADRAAIAY